MIRKASNSVVGILWFNEYPFPVLLKPTATFFITIITYPLPRGIINPTFNRIEIFFFEFHFTLCVQGYYKASQGVLGVLCASLGSGT